MKNPIVGLSVMVTLLCAWLLFEKSREVAAARARIALMERERAEMAAASAQDRKRLEARVSESRSRALESSMSEEALRRQLTGAQSQPRKHPTVSDLFKDQLMVEALKAEAREGSAKNVEQMFDDGLAEQLHLNADESAALKQLLIERMDTLWGGMMVPMATGQMSDAEMAQAGAEIKKALDDNSAEIRALLGDQGYQAYQWFDQTQDERETVRKFTEQEAGAGAALTPDQENQLMTVLTDTRTPFRAQSDFGNPDKMDFNDWYSNFSDDKIAAYGQGLGQVNVQILQGAQAFLTPDQLGALKESLAREALNGMMVVQSTKAMMAHDGQ